MPYFSLERYSGIRSATKSGDHPSRTLLQALYVSARKNRDMQQAISQLQDTPSDQCIHIAQIWCLIHDQSLLITCSRFPPADFVGSALTMKHVPTPVSPRRKKLARVIIRYGDSVKWALRIDHCRTWFGLISHFTEFWPRRWVVRQRGKAVTEEQWPELIAVATETGNNIYLDFDLNILPSDGITESATKIGHKKRGRTTFKPGTIDRRAIEHLGYEFEEVVGDLIRQEIPLSAKSAQDGAIITVHEPLDEQQIDEVNRLSREFQNAAIEEARRNFLHESLVQAGPEAQRPVDVPRESNTNTASQERLDETKSDDILVEVIEYAPKEAELCLTSSFTVLSWLGAKVAKPGEDLSKVDAFISDLLDSLDAFLRSSQFASAYMNCERRSRSEVNGLLEQDQNETLRPQQDGIRSQMRGMLSECMTAADSVFSFFIPPTFQGATIDSFWGSIYVIANVCSHLCRTGPLLTADADAAHGRARGR